MIQLKRGQAKIFFLAIIAFFPLNLWAQESATSLADKPAIIGTILLATIALFVAAFILVIRTSNLVKGIRENKDLLKWEHLKTHLINLEPTMVQRILDFRKTSKKQVLDKIKIPSKLTTLNDKVIYLINHISHPEIDDLLKERLERISFQLSGDELGSTLQVKDQRGLVISQTKDISSPIFDEKQKSDYKIPLDSDRTKIILGYIACAVFWLLFGTFIGLYLGIKFVAPDIDGVSFLSFGRLRPVHTNSVFWGWSSLAMIGLGYFVVSQTSNAKVYSNRLAWIALILMNISVFLGSVSLMAGINNGGGEYREYIWPIMALFAIGLVLTFYNYYKTVAQRKMADIYISNWYILAACIWTIVLTIIGYLPFYQEGLGETIIQGYYMHQGVGMWFMTFTLGLVYYFLPVALNKPIYSYSLGILAFWTQMLFYTLIGTHHFVFSPIPWWLQTVAIVFSGGMFIPVLAGTTNFLLTMKGSFDQIGKSYVLPFFLVGVVYYFIGSVQGSFQAFRFTNFVWHFTDFNVAHSHMTMYGIISFFLWGSIYAIIPKLIGKEPKQLLVGAHFWLAFIGLIAYTFALMIGGTYRGLSWIEGAPFIESVVLMVPYWLWRAVGGSFMFFSHVIFWYNLHLVYKGWRHIEDLEELPLEEKPFTTNVTSA